MDEKLNKFFKYCQNEFEYGWIDQDGNKHEGVNDGKTYCLQSPEELMKNKLGICWDRTELYRDYFKNMTDLKYETYYLLYDDEDDRERIYKVLLAEEKEKFILEGIEEGKKTGLEQGIKQGVKEGIKEGIEQGIERGIEQGIGQGIKKVAKTMIENNFQIEDIIKITGLTKDEILSLK